MYDIITIITSLTSLFGLRSKRILIFNKLTNITNINKFNKFNKFNKMEGLTNYQSFINSINQFEKNEHYLNLMCMNDTKNGPKTNKKENDQYLNDVIKLDSRDDLKKKCVLPKGHIGKCCTNLNCIFKENVKKDQNEHHEHDEQNKKTISKLLSSIELAIFQTPGNDDYVYKNRSQRLYHTVLDSTEEKKIRDKNIKKKCAIPLKDASTPILLVQAYLDWMTYMVNVKGMSGNLNVEASNYSSIMNMLSLNKEHLKKVYSNRKIFDDNGHSICVITKQIINMNDICDPLRDNRVNISDSDIQMGHNCPRSEMYVSIRGENLFPMSRRGNLIIGDRVFTEDEWINELKKIISSY